MYEQITLYNLFLKNDKIDNINIDSSLTKSLPTADGSKSIILYQSVIVYNGKILPFKKFFRFK